MVDNEDEEDSDELFDDDNLHREAVNVTMMW